MGDIWAGLTLGASDSTWDMGYHCRGFSRADVPSISLQPSAEFALLPGGTTRNLGAAGSGKF